MPIKIDGEIGYWGVTARDIKRELDNASGDITIEISSPGGSVYEGVSIFNAIKAYDKGEVTTIITSLAASMASYIALAGDKIKAYDNAIYMIHNASIISWGDARALRKDANHVESISNMLAKAYINKTGKSETEMETLLDDETYFYGDEILEAGFVDEIITSGVDGDSASAKALATESVKSCMSHYRENVKEEENEQVAALLKDETVGVNPVSNSASAKIENKPKGDSMSKKTYTDVEVKALTDEHAEALETTGSGATAAERERVGGIMALNGDAEFTAKAIEDGSSVGDAAIALVATQGAAMKKLKTDFEKGAESLANDDESETTDVTMTAEQKAEKEADDALDQVGGK